MHFSLQVSHIHLEWASMVPPQSVTYVATSVSALPTVLKLLQFLFFPFVLLVISLIVLTNHIGTLLSEWTITKLSYQICLPISNSFSFHDLLLAYQYITKQTYLVV